MMCSWIFFKFSIILYKIILFFFTFSVNLAEILQLEIIMNTKKFTFVGNAMIII